MAQWSNAVVTLSGIEMLNQVIDGKRLVLDYAAGGSDIVDAVGLMWQNGLKNQKQKFGIAGVSKADNGKKIHIVISNADLAQGYVLNQIGIWAHLDDEPSRMLCILQDESGVQIPSVSELLDFSLDFYAAIAMDNTGEMHVEMDPSALVSWGTLQDALASYIKAGEDGKIPSDFLPDMDYIPTAEKNAAGGVAGLDAQKKIVVAQLPMDTALSNTSENPVQNKVIYAALVDKVPTARKVNGKALSGDISLTAADVGARPSNWTPTAAQVGAAAASHGHTAATTGAAGFMSAADKSKLDGIAAGANKTTVDTALSSTSTNPVQNKVVNTALAGKAASSHNHDAGNITSGTLPIARGGTGATTAAAARTALGIKSAPIAIGYMGEGPVNGTSVLGFKPKAVFVCGYSSVPIASSDKVLVFFGTGGYNDSSFGANVTFNDNGFSLKTTKSYAISYIALGTPF